MSPKTFIFIGRSGCGKGTQAELLMKKLEVKEPVLPILHVETGRLFREFIKDTGYTASLSKKIYDDGGLQPEFLPVWLWSNYFVQAMEPNVHLVLDGTPRKLDEAKVLDSAMSFYKREKPTVVFINVSREWSKQRLLARHRLDDNAEDIEARLDWYEKDVSPAVDFYRFNQGYVFLDINGEQSVEAVCDEIMSKAGL